MDLDGGGACGLVGKRHRGKRSGGALLLGFGVEGMRSGVSCFVGWLGGEESGRWWMSYRYGMMTRVMIVLVLDSKQITNVFFDD